MNLAVSKMPPRVATGGLVERYAASNRLRLLTRVLYLGIVLVSAKVFLSILYQYQWYFPPDFDASPFLAGRRFTFTGLYRIAFYVHIAAGPLALMLGTILLASGRLARWKRAHRILGKTQLLVILATVVPSGLVMSVQAYAGPIAEIGFMVQSILTGVTVVVAAAFARTGNIISHRVWAIRCYVLLWSPLLLRVIAGWMIVTGMESVWTYRINAWLSWLLPLFLFECWLVRSNIKRANESRQTATADRYELIKRADHGSW